MAKTIIDYLSEWNPKIYKEDGIRMMCPFRENHIAGKGKGDGTSSFFISTSENVYHCFSCGIKGKATTLLVDKFDVPRYDAIELVNLDTLKKITKSEYELDFIWDILPPDEFLERGLSKEVLKKFMVGYKGKNICIPLFMHGVLKGVKFRLPDGRGFWYDAGFDRENFLLNYKRDYEYAVVVEGETDVFRVDDYGYDSVGLLSSHVTDGQLKLLREIPILYFALDNDPAGIKGMHYAYKKLKNDCEIRFINYPATDPCNCNKKLFQKAFKNYCSYAEFSIETA